MGRKIKDSTQTSCLKWTHLTLIACKSLEHRHLSNYIQNLWLKYIVFCSCDSTMIIKSCVTFRLKILLFFTSMSISVFLSVDKLTLFCTKKNKQLKSLIKVVKGKKGHHEHISGAWYISFSFFFFSFNLFSKSLYAEKFCDEKFEMVILMFMEVL